MIKSDLYIPDIFYIPNEKWLENKPLNLSDKRLGIGKSFMIFSSLTCCVTDNEIKGDMCNASPTHTNIILIQMTSHQSHLSHQHQQLACF